MMPRERILRAFRFEPTDRIPRFIVCWGQHVAQWAAKHGNPPEMNAAIREAYGSDMLVVSVVEGLWPSKAKVLESKKGMTVRRTDWGEVVREKESVAFFSAFSCPLPPAGANSDLPGEAGIVVTGEASCWSMERSKRVYNDWSFAAISCASAASETSTSIEAPCCWDEKSTSGIGTFFDRFALSFITSCLTF